jgi:hypothetical protein
MDERWCCGTAPGTAHDGSCPARSRPRPKNTLRSLAAEDAGPVCVACHRAAGDDAVVCVRCAAAMTHDAAVWTTAVSAHYLKSVAPSRDVGLML